MLQLSEGQGLTYSNMHPKSDFHRIDGGVESFVNGWCPVNVKRLFDIED